MIDIKPEVIADNIIDEDWRLRNLFAIRNKKAKTQIFKMNRTQEILDASPDKLNMVLKSRQQGVTTYYVLKYLNRAMFTDNYTGAIISHDRQSIEKLFRVVKFAYKNFPDSMKPRLDRGGGSKHEYFFPDLNSRIYVSLEVRSEAITDLHVSEYGLMKNKDRFNASVDAVPPEGNISIESTPFGVNHFYYDWNDPEFPFKKHFFPWFIHHENKETVNSQSVTRLTLEEEEVSKSCEKLTGKPLTKSQIKWRRTKIKMKGINSFKEEHPEDDVTCFMMSGNSVVDLNFYANLINNLKPPLENHEGVKIMEYPIQGEKYVIGADTAEGVGTDYSVASVVKKSTREQVAIIRGHFKPKKFADMIYKIAEKYDMDRSKPLIAVERNNHGHAVLLWLDEGLHYPNLFKHDDDRIGWKTNKVTRPIMLDTMLDAIEEEEFFLREHTSLNECMKLIDKNGKIEAMDGEHDDTVIANAIALQMCIQRESFLESMLR